MKGSSAVRAAATARRSGDDLARRVRAQGRTRCNEASSEDNVAREPWTTTLMAAKWLAADTEETRIPTWVEGGAERSSRGKDERDEGYLVLPFIVVEEARGGRSWAWSLHAGVAVSKCSVKASKRGVIAEMKVVREWGFFLECARKREETSGNQDFGARQWQQLSAAVERRKKGEEGGGRRG